ncbi:MAG: Crp/Fnr family transcriptional regulator [Vicingaceae bacterium]|nr:MAG: Crp/Fnr family transcriptional regulator [Vicingaceae bacterium]
MKDFMNADFIEKAKQYGIRKKFKAGEVVLDQDSYIRSLPVVSDGILKIVKISDDGLNEITIYHLEKGDSCIMSFLSGLYNEKSKFKIIALEDSEIIMIPIEKWSFFLREDPSFLQFIFQNYHDRFNQLVETIDAIAFKKMDERLLYWLRKKSAIYQNNIIPITHEELSKELNTSRVVVSRLLKKLEQDGVLLLKRNEIVLL